MLVKAFVLQNLRYSDGVKFRLIDTILEISPGRIVALKQVSLAEEYLADHFPSFPVLPGVMMIEAMVQAAREMLIGLGAAEPLVLGEVKALKFGNMVRPGEALEVEITLAKRNDDGSYHCRGVGIVRKRGETMPDVNAAETAVSGKFTMRPVRRS